MDGERSGRGEDDCMKLLEKKGAEVMVKGTRKDGVDEGVKR